MNEAKQMHDELLNELQSILPRTVYQDVRRLSTLVWAMVGLCLTNTVRLSAWAEVQLSRAQYAASRVRRFSRWLHHPAISPFQWYKPLLQAALINWPSHRGLYVALDTTALTPFVLIRASLVYRGRAIPLTWRALRHKSTSVSFEVYRPVLEQVRAILPPDAVITLLADSGFANEQLLHYLQEHHWHFRIRLPGSILVHLSERSICAVRQLCPPTGQERFLGPVAIFGTAVGPVHLALARLIASPDDPWFVVSDEPTSAQTWKEYGWRFDTEEIFLDEKSGGYQIQTSDNATPEAVERLILILAMTTVHLTSIGVEVVQAEKRRYVDTHWDRGLSYFKIGWRWRRQQYQRSWSAFASFELDPAPDPLPVFASRRAFDREKNHIPFQTAA